MSKELYSSLLLLDESEWYCLNHGKEITKKWLTQKLLTFAIKPVKKSHANVFLVEDLQDAFDSYRRTLELTEIEERLQALEKSC